MNLRKVTQIIFLQAFLLSTPWLITTPSVGAKPSFFTLAPINSIIRTPRNIPLNSAYQANIEPTIQVTETNNSENSIFLPVINAPSVKAYYISPGGVDPSDCSGGTPQRPWKTWTKAQRCIAPNSVVYFMAGNYSNIFAQSGQTTLTFKGAENEPIIIKAAPGAEGQVFFNQTLNIYGAYGILSGIDINGSTRSSEPTVGIYGAHHITIENSKIHNSSIHDCLHIYKSSDFISLINNEVYNCGYANADYNGPGDAIDATGGTNLVYQGNHVHHALTGLQIKGGAANVLVENNRIHDVGIGIVGATMTALNGSSEPQHGNPQMHDPAVPVEARYQAKNVLVRNNLIYNTTESGSITTGGWTDFTIVNNTFFNLSDTTIFHMYSAKWYFFDSTALTYCTSHQCQPCTEYTGSLPCVAVLLPAKNGTIKNNIAFGFGRVLWAAPGNTTNLKMAKNLYFDSDFSSSIRTYQLGNSSYNFDQFQALGQESGSLIANPQFVDPTNLNNPNLRLKASSPAIDRGDLLPQVTQDFDGVPRPQGSAHDLGAFEFINP